VSKSQEFMRARVVSRNPRQLEILDAVRVQYDRAMRPANDTGPVAWCEIAPKSKDAEAGSPRPATSLSRTGTRSVLDLPLPSEERLKSLFDLTGAEARLAQRLATGDSVEEVAQRLNIKMTTARTQLAAIFAKTDTRRQAKLVAILSHIAHVD
jgi:DNA-binding CsgD family transcriptional regulator